MIEHCTNLASCESILQEAASHITLLGEIPLTEEDIENLTKFIQDATSSTILGKQQVPIIAPTAFACFLTWKGIREYKDGSYWPAVEDTIGQLDVNWRSRWGQAYHTFLCERGLPTFELEGSHAYITPILTHGGIPNSCLEEYFERVVLSLVRRELMDPTDVEEIHYILEEWRNFNAERCKLEEREQDLHLLLERSEPSPDDHEKPSANTQESVQVIQRALDSIDRKRLELTKTQDAFTEKDRAFIDLGGEIDELILRQPRVEELRENAQVLKTQEQGLLDEIQELWNELSDQQWLPEYNDAIRQLPMEALSIEFDQLGVERISTYVSIITHPPSTPFDQKYISRIPKIATVLIAIVGLMITLAGIYTGAIVILILGITIAALGICAFWRIQRSSPNIEHSRESINLPYPTIDEYLPQQSPCQEIIRLAHNLPLSEMKIKTSGSRGYLLLVHLTELVSRLCELQINLVGHTKEIEGYQASLFRAVSTLGINSNRDESEILTELTEKHSIAIEREFASREAHRKLLQEIVTEEMLLQAELTQAESDTTGRPGRNQDQQRQLPGEDRSHVVFNSILARAESESPAEARPLLEEELASVEDELLNLPRILSGIDEPIRRYLLYAGDPAETFLAGSVRLLHNSMLTGIAPTGEEIQLSTRVVTNFEKWWTTRSTTEKLLSNEDDGILRQGAHAPVIFLDPDIREVRFRLKAQTLPKEAREIVLEVTGDGVGLDALRQGLRLYTSDSGEVETQELDSILPFPAGGFTFRILAGSDPLRTWEIPTPGIGRIYMAFSYRTGRILRDSTLPKERIWLLLKEDCSLEPTGCIILDGGRMLGGWHEYRLFEIDLSEVDQLIVRRKRDRIATLDVAYGEPPGIELVNATPLIGVRLAGLDTYQGELPALKVFIGSASSLHRWRLSVHPGASSSLLRRKYINLNELDDALSYDEEGKSVLINLAHNKLLGPDAQGEFHIRLHRTPYSDWRRSLCVVNYLAFKFKEPFYLPSPSQPSFPIQAEVRYDPQSSLTVEASTRVIQDDRGQALVQVDSHENFIRGKLDYRPEAGGFSFPLEVDLPKIRWRLHGTVDPELTSWQDEIREVWLGTPMGEISLLIQSPPALENWQFSLSIGGCTTKKLEEKAREGKVRFDLQNFSESLRAGPSLQSFVLDVRDRDREYAPKEAPLLWGRTRWEATDIECVQDHQADKVILNVSWTEYGKETEKEVRLWSLATIASKNAIASQKIGANIRSTRLILSASDLRSGEYLVEIAPVETWTATIACRPSQGTMGTLLIKIAGKAELRKGETLILETIQDDRGQARILTKRYRLRISGRILNRQRASGNQGWFAAVLDVSKTFDPDDEEATRYVAEIEAGNPYKLDYNSEKSILKAIEDRYSEGAMYCHDCKVLYWDESRLKDEERRLKHKLDGPIELFSIRTGH